MKTIKAIALFLVIMVCSCRAISATTHGFHPFRKMIAIGGTALIAQACKPGDDHKSKCLQNFHLGDDVYYAQEETDMDDGPKAAKGDSKILRKVLNQERVASGMPPDPDDCHAHHIVASSDKRAEEARNIITNCGVRINSAENGVFLPSKKEGSGCTGVYHPKMHDDNYYAVLLGRLQKSQRNGCQGVLKELRYIKIDLTNGGI